MDSCVLWTGLTNSKGYGVVYSQSKGVRKTTTASRWTWEQAYGPAPAKMDVAHSCDTPLCVNLSHLSLMTHRENLLQMVARGRHPRHTQTQCPKHGIEYDVRWKSGRRCSQCLALKNAKRREARALKKVDLLPDKWSD